MIGGNSETIESRSMSRLYSITWVATNTPFYKPESLTELTKSLQRRALLSRFPFFNQSMLMTMSVFDGTRVGGSLE